MVSVINDIDELTHWKQKWAKAHNKLLEIAHFYGDVKHWQPDEADVIIVHYDRGQLARETIDELYSETESETEGE